MLVDDLLLYAALFGGWLIGRRFPARGPWPGRASLAAVVVLVGLLGASFRAIDGMQVLAVLPWAFVFAAAILATTAGVYFALEQRSAPLGAGDEPPAPPTRDRVPTSGLLLLALGGGYGIGRLTPLPTASLIPLALAVLLLLVGYGLELSLRSVRRAWLPIASAAVAVVAVAGIASLAARVWANAVWATALGFGWYSLTGPLVAARWGATVGLFAFLANFLREAMTMLLSPYIGRRLRGEGLAALGGATSMDTTLYFVVRYGDRRAGTLAVASGLTLTVAASLLVPFVLAL